MNWKIPSLHRRPFGTRLSLKILDCLKPRGSSLNVMIPNWLETVWFITESEDMNYQKTCWVPTSLKPSGSSLNLKIPNCIKPPDSSMKLDTS